MPAVSALQPWLLHAELARSPSHRKRVCTALLLGSWQQRMPGQQALFIM